MTTDPPVPEDRSPTEAKILDAAVSCVRRYGIRRTTLEEVARVAGVSRGSIYNYFPDKDALMTTVFSRADSEFVAEGVRVTEGESTLAGKAAALAVWIREQVASSALLNLDETEPETAVLVLTQGGARMLDNWLEFWPPHFAAAQARGEVRADLDVPRAIEWMMRIILSLATTPARTFDLDDPAQVRAFIEDHLVRGWQ